MEYAPHVVGSTFPPPFVLGKERGNKSVRDVSLRDESLSYQFLSFSSVVHASDLALSKKVHSSRRMIFLIIKRACTVVSSYVANTNTVMP